MRDGEEAGWFGGVKDREVDKWDPLICWEEIFVQGVRMIGGERGRLCVIVFGDIKVRPYHILFLLRLVKL